MLQSFRDNLKGTVATVLVGLMIIPFALFGVDSLFLSDGSAGDAAEVDGVSISENELAQAVFMQKQQLLSRFGQNAPADFLTDERLRQPVLDDLIRRRLSTRVAADGGMAANSAELDKIILSMAQFQVEGRFDPQVYTQTLRSMGFTPSTYKKLLSEEIVLSQLASGFASTAFATEAEGLAGAVLREQTRDFYYLTIGREGISDSVSISEEEVDAYYQANQAEFMAAQKVAITYIEASPDLLSENIEVSEEDILAQYEVNLANFEASTERRAAHILFESKDDDSHSAQAQAVAARLAAGEAFAALAEELSDDRLSAEQGGDLGFSSGDIFPDSFEEALAALEVGGVSEPIETDAGLHLIKLLEVQGSAYPSLDDERMAISESLKAAAAEEQFVELLDDLGDLTYNADSLQEAAEALNLSVGQSELFSRAGGVGLTAEAAVLEAAFSEEVLVDGNSSDVIELSDNRVVVLRISENQPAHVKALVDVSEQIAQNLKEQASRDALQALAADLSEQLKQGADFESLAKEKGLEWQVSIDTRRNDFTVDNALVRYVFELPKPAGAPQIGGVFLAEGDYAVVSLNKVTQGSAERMTALQKQQMTQGLARSSGQTEYAAFEAYIKAEADVRIN